MFYYTLFLTLRLCLASLLILYFTYEQNATVIELKQNSGSCWSVKQKLISDPGIFSSKLYVTACSLPLDVAHHTAEKKKSILNCIIETNKAERRRWLLIEYMNRQSH